MGGVSRTGCQSFTGDTEEEVAGSKSGSKAHLLGKSGGSHGKGLQPTGSIARYDAANASACVPGIRSCLSIFLITERR